MRDRLITAAGALVALVLIISLLFQPQNPNSVALPTSEEVKPNGYAGLWRWLEAENIPVASYRVRVSASDLEASFVPRGNLMISTVPFKNRFNADEIAQLRTWVIQGNTLLLMAALNDTPDWAIQADTDHFQEDIRDLTGLSFTAIEGTETEFRFDELLGEKALLLNGIGEHPLMQGVVTLRGISDYPSSAWTPSFDNSYQLALQMAEDAETGEAAMWEVTHGAGRVIVAGSGTLLTNRQLGEADNAQLFRNIVEYHLLPGATVIFDDMHQGLSNLFDPAAFYSDARVGKTALFVLAFWFIYMVGSSGRLAAPVNRPAFSHQGDFVQAMGGLLARKLVPADMGRLMFVNGLGDIGRRLGWLGAADDRTAGLDLQTLWQQLAQEPMLDRASIDRLQQYYIDIQGGKKVNLIALNNEIQAVRKVLG